MLDTKLTLPIELIQKSFMLLKEDQDNRTKFESLLKEFNASCIEEVPFDQIEAFLEKGKSLLPEGYEGFKKLEGKLSHEKGVSNPGALAAAIGRKKYGAKNFQKHADEHKTFKEEPHPDAKADKDLVKTMVKKDALKEEGPGEAVTEEKASSSAAKRYFQRALVKQDKKEVEGKTKELKEESEGPDLHKVLKSHGWKSDKNSDTSSKRKAVGWGSVHSYDHPDKPGHLIDYSTEDGSWNHEHEGNLIKKGEGAHKLSDHLSSLKEQPEEGSSLLKLFEQRFNPKKKVNSLEEAYERGPWSHVDQEAKSHPFHNDVVEAGWKHKETRSDGRGTKVHVYEKGDKDLALDGHHWTAGKKDRKHLGIPGRGLEALKANILHSEEFLGEASNEAPNIQRLNFEEIEPYHSALRSRGYISIKKGKGTETYVNPALQHHGIVIHPDGWHSSSGAKGQDVDSMDTHINQHKRTMLKENDTVHSGGLPATGDDKEDIGTRNLSMDDVHHEEPLKEAAESDHPGNKPEDPLPKKDSGKSKINMIKGVVQKARLDTNSPEAPGDQTDPKENQGGPENDQDAENLEALGPIIKGNKTATGRPREGIDVDPALQGQMGDQTRGAQTKSGANL